VLPSHGARRPPTAVHPCLDLRGPDDLRRTFATWLEDAGIPSRVIDELMGHVGTKCERAQGASPMGRVYRETTLAMAARVTEVLDEKLTLARRRLQMSSRRFRRELAAPRESIVLMSALPCPGTITVTRMSI
jgi:hypothetical protein